MIRYCVKKTIFYEGSVLYFNVIAYLLIDVLNVFSCPVSLWLNIPLILLFSYIMIIVTVVGHRVLRDSNQGE